MAIQTKKICDRCGEDILGKKFPYMKLNKIKMYKVYGLGEYDNFGYQLDLCKKCTEDFDEWMNEKE